MKKHVSALLLAAASAVLGLTGCGGGGSSPSAAPTTASAKVDRSIVPACNAVKGKENELLATLAGEGPYSAMDAATQAEAVKQIKRFATLTRNLKDETASPELKAAIDAYATEMDKRGTSVPTAAAPVDEVMFAPSSQRDALVKACIAPQSGIGDKAIETVTVCKAWAATLAAGPQTNPKYRELTEGKLSSAAGDQVSREIGQQLEGMIKTETDLAAKASDEALRKAIQADIARLQQLLDAANGKLSWAKAGTSNDVDALTGGRGVCAAVPTALGVNLLV